MTAMEMERVLDEIRDGLVVLRQLERRINALECAAEANLAGSQAVQACP